MTRISQPTLSGKVLFESCVVLFSLGCNPASASFLRQTVSGALDVFQKSYHAMVLSEAGWLNVFPEKNYMISSGPNR
jgi:hypothetical protein